MKPRGKLDALDRTICQLESLAHILIQITSDDDQIPSMATLADLGRVMCSLSNEALELVSEMDEEILNDVELCVVEA